MNGAYKVQSKAKYPGDYTMRATALSEKLPLQHGDVKAVLSIGCFETSSDVSGHFLLIGVYGLVRSLYEYLCNCNRIVAENSKN